MTTINFKSDSRIFEWNREKARLNKIKHGISFKVAVRVFDEAHSEAEECWQVIGKVEEILFVVYTERDDCTRIISARVATAAERELYYGDGDIYFA